MLIVAFEIALCANAFGKLPNAARWQPALPSSKGRIPAGAKDATGAVE
jgi:hypothetical protein